MANVLAVFAHPDDEVLGAGGTLAKHAENGDDVLVLFICETRASDHIVAAIETLSKFDISICDVEIPDQTLDTVPLSRLVRSMELGGDPDVIYTHHPGDLNKDHSLTAQAVLTAFRPKPGERPRTILACEILSSTEWTFPYQMRANWFVSLSPEQLEKKIDAMRCYGSELQEWPHPRSVLGIRNQAAARGQQAGVERAEAFELLRGGPF